MADINANMARFMEAKERAKKLIQMDANGSLDKYGKDKINEFRGGYGEDGSTSQSIIPENVHNVQRDYSQVQISNSKLSNSKLPSEILESFKNKQINTDLLGVNVGQASVLDLFQEEKKVQAPIIEQTNVISAKNEENLPKSQIVSSNVDYSLIKTIVEDTMKKYASALKKSIINENKSLMSEDNNLQALKIGNKFTFITKNGDLYEANLKFVRNINDK